MELKNLYKKVGVKVNDFLYSNGLRPLSIHKEDSRVLVYHGVTKNAKTDINARFISTSVFENQLRFFKDHFTLCTLEELISAPSKSRKMRLSLTFDDGYLNNLDEVIPLLEKYQIPATFFITTIRLSEFNYLWADLLDLHRYTGPDSFQFMGKEFFKKGNEYVSKAGSLKQLLKASAWELKKSLSKQIISENNFIADNKYAPYCQLMNEAQLQQLSRSTYATIGSHGVYHNCLTSIDLKAAEWELIESKKYLENITQKEVSFMAYPDGAYNKELVNLCDRAGYKHQSIVDYADPNDSKDPRLVPRFGINPYIGLKYQMQCIVDGHY